MGIEDEREGIKIKGILVNDYLESINYLVFGTGHDMLKFLTAKKMVEKSADKLIYTTAHEFAHHIIFMNTAQMGRDSAFEKFTSAAYHEALATFSGDVIVVNGLDRRDDFMRGVGSESKNFQGELKMSSKLLWLHDDSNAMGEKFGYALGHAAAVTVANYAQTDRDTLLKDMLLERDRMRVLGRITDLAMESGIFDPKLVSFFKKYMEDKRVDANRTGAIAPSQALLRRV